MTGSQSAIWDFWYVNLGNREIIAFFLFADREKFESGIHHWHAGIGFRKCEISYSALSECIDKINQGDFEVALLPESPGYCGSSYWTGSVLALTDGTYEFYFTHRNPWDQPTKQIIRLATSQFPDQGEWKIMTDWKCEADGDLYARADREGDSTIQAWRDPFVYRIDDELHMLVCAKAERVADVRYAGCVGHLVRVSENRGWKYLPPIIPAGRFSECECPHVRKIGGRVRAILFSCQKKFVSPEVLSHYGAGGLFEFDLRSGKYRLLIDENETGAYACRLVDELSVFVGFKKDLGVLTVIES